MTHEILRYGPDRAQVAEVWRPRDRDGALPVVVLIHGGFWRQMYTKRLMRRMARALVTHGWIAYNIEYRRIGPWGHGGWPETFDDVAVAIDALSGVEGADLRRVATCGHSAGGHLALWAGSSRVTGTPRRTPTAVGLCAAVSLAGVVDLVAAARDVVGGTAISDLMGGSPHAVPDRYALGSPASLLPMGTPQLLLHGLDDRSVPPSLSADYVDTARSRGDAAEYVPLPGVTHLEMITARGRPFGELVPRLEKAFSSVSDVS
jgi:acetyl esterase/lipase